jgi:hypothetical protein
MGATDFDIDTVGLPRALATTKVRIGARFFSSTGRGLALSPSLTAAKAHMHRTSLGSDIHSRFSRGLRVH